MKKSAALILALAMIFALCACGSAGGASKTAKAWTVNHEKDAFGDETDKWSIELAEPVAGERSGNKSGTFEATLIVYPFYFGLTFGEEYSSLYSNFPQCAIKLEDGTILSFHSEFANVHDGGTDADITSPKELRLRPSIDQYEAMVNALSAGQLLKFSLEREGTTFAFQIEGKDFGVAYSSVPHESDPITEEELIQQLEGDWWYYCGNDIYTTMFTFYSDKTLVYYYGNGKKYEGTYKINDTQVDITLTKDPYNATRALRFYYKDGNLEVYYFDDVSGTPLVKLK